MSRHDQVLKAIGDLEGQAVRLEQALEDFCAADKLVPLTEGERYRATMTEGALSNVLAGLAVSHALLLLVKS